MAKHAAIAALCALHVILLFAFDSLAQEHLLSYGVLFQALVYIVAVINVIIGYERVRKMLKLAEEV